MPLGESDRRHRIHNRIRRKIQGTPVRPRLAVYRSNKAIYCQLIDDSKGLTLASASSIEEGASSEGTKSDVAKQVGIRLAEKASAANISTVVFDRGGYLFHGRVKALAEGAREGGLKF